MQDTNESLADIRRLVQTLDVPVKQVLIEARIVIVNDDFKRELRDAFYTDTDDVVLLAIDPERLTAPVKHEARAPGAEEFPHIYGPLPVNAIVNVTVPAR